MMGILQYLDKGFRNLPQQFGHVMITWHLSGEWKQISKWRSHFFNLAEKTFSGNSVSLLGNPRKYFDILF